MRHGEAEMVCAQFDMRAGTTIKAIPREPSRASALAAVCKSGKTALDGRIQKPLRV